MARTERSEGSAIHTSGVGGLQDRRHSRLLLSSLGLRFGAFPTLEPRRIDRPVTERTEIEKSSRSFSGFGSGDAQRRRATTSALFAKPLRTEPGSSPRPFLLAPRRLVATRPRREPAPSSPVESRRTAPPGPRTGRRGRSPRRTRSAVPDKRSGAERRAARPERG